MVDTDLHVGAPVTVGGTMTGGDTSAPTTPYPGGCKDTPMSPQLNALEFIFFPPSPLGENARSRLGPWG